MRQSYRFPPSKEKNLLATVSHPSMPDHWLALCFTQTKQICKLQVSQYSFFFFFTSNVLFARKQVAKKNKKREERADGFCPTWSASPPWSLNEPRGQLRIPSRNRTSGASGALTRYLPPSSHASALVPVTALVQSAPPRATISDCLHSGHGRCIERVIICPLLGLPWVHLIWWMCNFLCLHAVS